MNEVLHTLFERKPEPKDYIAENGLLYCGKCHTPKQRFMEKETLEKCRAINPNFPAIVSCDCECMQEFQIRFDCEKSIAEAEGRRRNCFPPESNFTKCRFDSDKGWSDREAMQKAHKYADKFSELFPKGIGLLVHGDVGRGKSFLVACIANEIMEAGFTCRMTNFTRIADGSFNRSDKEAYFDEFSIPDLLILDDFGAERQTEFVQEVVYKVLEYRVNSGKPMILTTNLNPEKQIFGKAKKSLDETRIFSRLAKAVRLIAMHGADIREMEAIETAHTSMKILGF